MTKSDFYKYWKLLKCDLCGGEEESQRMTTVVMYDLMGKVKIRLCQKCTEQVTDNFCEISKRNRGER